MNVTRDVVKDLLTVYLAGDASPDTRALVENWLRTDPELARLADEARRGDLPPVALPEPSAEKREVTRTRRRLKWRMVVMGAAVYFTLVAADRGVQQQGLPGSLDRGLGGTHRSAGGSRRAVDRLCRPDSPPACLRAVKMRRPGAGTANQLTRSPVPSADRVVESASTNRVWSDHSSADRIDHDSAPA